MYSPPSDGTIMVIYIGADHRGFELKNQLVSWLQEYGHTVIDCGNMALDPNDDFPDFAFAVAARVVKDPDSRGIVICGSGGGVTIAANKVRGIRCALAISTANISDNRRHNNINVLALAADSTDLETAKTYIDAFLSTEFEGKEKHVRRIGKITERETKQIA
jgi:ribose 5-phosphate isomerase B